VKTLRQVVAKQMVRVHLVRPELADEWVRTMSAGEVKQRFKFYAGMELSVVGPPSQSRKPVSTRLPGPATPTAGRTALNPVSDLGEARDLRPVMPEAEASNLVRSPRRVSPRRESVEADLDEGRVRVL